MKLKCNINGYEATSAISNNLLYLGDFFIDSKKFIEEISSVKLEDRIFVPFTLSITKLYIVVYCILRICRSDFLSQFLLFEI